MTSSSLHSVSVLMPVRDAQETLGHAIESIVRQTFCDWELVVVDDGSRDASPEIAQSWAERDSRIRALRLPPRGIVSSLNHAISVARGTFLARMDADDSSHPTRLARQIESLEAHPEIGVVSCLVQFGGDAEAARGYAAHVAWLNDLCTPDAIALSRFIESPLAHPSVVFRRSLVEAHGAYRQGDFPEDYELWLRWMDAGVRFAKVGEKLLTWNDAATRLSRTDPRYAVEAFYRVKCNYLGRWLTKNVTSDRPVWLWGAGRVTRKRFRTLEHTWKKFQGFVDIDPKKIGRTLEGRNFVAPSGIPPEAFVLVAVSSRGARDRIRAVLHSQGREEKTDFLCAA